MSYPPPPATACKTLLNLCPKLKWFHTPQSKNHQLNLYTVQVNTVKEIFSCSGENTPCKFQPQFAMASQNQPIFFCVVFGSYWGYPTTIHL